jgi:hypothetical protein
VRAFILGLFLIVACSTGRPDAASRPVVRERTLMCPTPCDGYCCSADAVCFNGGCLRMLRDHQEDPYPHHRFPFPGAV